MKNSFTSELNFYKLFWIFIIFSILGFTFESAYCSILCHKFLLFHGLIYGPFSQIYGFGAVLFILFSKLFNIKNPVIIFALYAFVGTLYEFISSYLEEVIFGFVAWDYSNKQWNIQGRINLEFIFIWGLAGIIIIKYLFPLINKMLDKILNKPGIAVTWLLIIFISFDIFITVQALNRQAERKQSIPASNNFELFLDSKYPDSFIKAIKPGLHFK